MCPAWGKAEPERARHALGEESPPHVTAVDDQTSHVRLYTTPTSSRRLDIPTQHLIALSAAFSDRLDSLKIRAPKPRC